MATVEAGGSFHLERTPKAGTVPAEPRQWQTPPNRRGENVFTQAFSKDPVDPQVRRDARIVVGVLAALSFVGIIAGITIADSGASTSPVEVPPAGTVPVPFNP